MRVERVTKKENVKFCGFQDDKGIWHTSIDKVRNYLEVHIPCNIDIEAMNDGTVESVKIINSDNERNDEEKIAINIFQDLDKAVVNLQDKLKDIKNKLSL